MLRSEAQEAAHVAARLRHAHLVDGVPWSQMAVLVRSTVHAMPVLRRAMVAAGVPVAVSGDEVPLVQEPAVRPLLLLLRCATRPETLDEDAAVELLTSPVGGADVMGLRRLRQVLRRAELDAGGRRASGPLLVEALDDPTVLIALPQSADPAGGGGRGAARRSPARRWPRREPPPRTCCGSCGSAPGSPSAGSGPAARAVRRARPPTATSTRWWPCSRPRPGSATGCPAPAPRCSSTTCSASRSPATSPRSAPVGDEAVQVLTAHASKGLEWDVVCVAGVQEGIWPDLRMRGSFLGSERLVDLLRPGGEPMATAVATAATLGRLLEEERRLFYVAVTRARRALLVTAVTSEREALSPSRFLDEIDPLAGDDPRPLTPVRRPLSLTSLVAELRQTVTDPDADDALRSAAAARLAALAAAGARGADPDSWWGLPALSDERPVRAEDESVAVSPSKVESFRRCELRWFLEHVGGGDTAGAAQSVGTLVHAVAEARPDAGDEHRGGAAGPAAGAAADRRPRLRLGRPQGAREGRGHGPPAGRLAGRERARGRGDRAGLRGRGRPGPARRPGRPHRARRRRAGRGRRPQDRREQGAGRTSCPSTGSWRPTSSRSSTAPSTGWPRAAAPSWCRSGRPAARTSPCRGSRRCPASDDPGWARTLVLEVAEGMAGSAFRAVDNRYCAMCPVRTSCPVQDDGRAVTS